MKNILFLSITLCFLSIPMFSQTVMPAFFSDSMVLQQQTDAVIWGNDKPKTKITVKASWGKTSNTFTDQDGKWRLKLSTTVAGGPHSIEIMGSSKLTFRNVLLGEVWLCSGQSNMEMPVKGYNSQPIIGSNEAILNSSNPNIRVFGTPRMMSRAPVTNVKGYWKHACPANTGDFSATGYFFAKKLNDILGVPIGLIVNAWGGSSVESWMDSTTLASFKKVEIPEKPIYSAAQNTHTIMYNSMLHPYIGYTIKGALWYQGESNRRNPNEYEALFSSMIGSWRSQWQQGDFPFYFVQLAPHSTNENTTSAMVREAQLKTMKNVPNTGMAVTLDIGEQNLIHPSQKSQVGHRLAYWALAKDYKIKGIGYSGPIFKQIEAGKNSDSLIISFDYADMGMTTFGKPLTDFEVAGEDKVFYPAKAIFTKDRRTCITVWNENVKNPVSVRYAFNNWVQGSLFNTQGLPASSFRTDNW
jgi:sialate O-acetylesterase